MAIVTRDASWSVSGLGARGVGARGGSVLNRV